MVGFVTLYIAGELRAQRARLGWTMDELSLKSGVPKATVANTLKPRGAISAENLAALAGAMRMDAGAIMSDAVKASHH